MKDDSRLVRAFRKAAGLIDAVWGQLGEIDRVLDRRRLVPDREYAAATAVVRESVFVRGLARLAAAWNPSGSAIVAQLASASSRFERLERWQQVRLVGVAATSGFTVYALLWLVLPTRFAPSLPMPVWILAATLGVVCIVACRTVAAAWDDWNR